MTGNDRWNHRIGLSLSAFLAGAAFVALQFTWIQWQQPAVKYAAATASTDLAVLLVLLMPGALVARRAPRFGAVTTALLSFFWVCAYSAQLQFLIETGTFASRPLIQYSLANILDVGEVALSGADRLFYLKTASGIGLMVAAVIARPLHRTFQQRTVAIAVAVAAGAIVLGAYASPRPLNGVAGPILNAGFALDLPPLVGLQSRYEAPRISATSAKADRPSIVLWIVESGRADLIEPKNPEALPVFLNRLARESVVFRRAYTTTSHTSKALVGILCGHYPHPDMRIREASSEPFPLVCLPRLLKELGYQTYFLQAALGSFENRPGLTRNFGFDQTIVQEDLSPEFMKAGYFGMDERALIKPHIAAVADSSNKPKFIAVLTNITHHPYAKPGESEPGESPFDAYRSAVEYVDEFLADLYAELSSHIDWRETVMIVIGDHGEAFAEHGIRQHDSVSYEEVVRVPLFIRYPNKLEPRIDNALRQSVDILPTILEMLRLSWTGQFVGKNLLDEAGHSSIVTTCWPTRTCHAVVSASGAKVVFYFGERKEEIYNVLLDPQERRDLSSIVEPEEIVLDSAVRIASARRWAEAPYEEVPKRLLTPPGRR